MIEMLVLTTALVHAEEVPTQPAFTCDSPGATLQFSCVGIEGERIAFCESPGEASERQEHRLELVAADGSASRSLGLSSSVAPFRFNHYSRFQTEYLEISARTDHAEYRVYKHYLGEFGDEKPSYGLLITDIKSGTEQRFECAKEVFDDLSVLPDVLECDRENALGCGAFEDQTIDRN
ncbi:hypothetical protein [Alkalisalibacterium limincola]|uniref:Uncharacterized protein n=1 Tax=Alkalisalibacterium limincola TaxID=2699169 RepID=A0A5C8KL85_9GAMM|nr:hypothetical protein [Alkalisalibacterium limincola]TXK60979.1 hypothetical protein FU658_10385 [Alkalisalibacterium limincola]